MAVGEGDVVALPAGGALALALGLGLKFGLELELALGELLGVGSRLVLGLGLAVSSACPIVSLAASAEIWANDDERRARHRMAANIAKSFRIACGW